MMTSRASWLHASHHAPHDSLKLLLPRLASYTGNLLGNHSCLYLEVYFCPHWITFWFVHFVIINLHFDPVLYHTCSPSQLRASCKFNKCILINYNNQCCQSQEGPWQSPTPYPLALWQEIVINLQTWLSNQLCAHSVIASSRHRRH